MKISSSLSIFVLAAVALVHGVSAAPADAAAKPGADAVAATQKDLEAAGRLDDLRDQMRLYESSIIHAYLARAALGGSVAGETIKTVTVLQSTPHAKASFAVPDEATAKWFADEKGGKKFVTSDIFPPGTNYATPDVLDDDAVLDKGFPTGRRPQDASDIVVFLVDKWHKLKQNPQLDPASLASLDASLFNLISARMSFGYQIGLAKFNWQNEQFCGLLTAPPASTDPKEAAKALENKITDLLTDDKVQVNLFRRVEYKAKVYSWTPRGDPAYPETVRDDILRLFQAYIVPITTAIETEAVIQQAHTCPGYKAPAPPAKPKKP